MERSMTLINGDRLLKWLQKEYQAIYRGRENMPGYATGAMVELRYVIDHVERMMKKGCTDGKKD